MSNSEGLLVPGSVLVKLLEHNNWANLEIIEACSALSDQQLEARDRPGTWCLRQVLSHIVESQAGYLSLLTQPLEARRSGRVPFEQLRGVASESGEGLLALAQDESGEGLNGTLRTTDGYEVEPWVVMVQVVNHATEHRRQIAALLRSLGVTPPRLDGWAHGEATGALTQLAE